MKSLLVYDPPMCCSTGVCGADVDQRIVTFAADLDWLKGQGLEVKRINLSQEPAEFAANATVSAVLQSEGVDGLPVLLMGGEKLSSGCFPTRAQLAGWAGLADAPGAGDSGETSEPSGCCGDSGETTDTSSGCCGGSGEAEDAPSGCC